jgi:hypothetical protein
VLNLDDAARAARARVALHIEVAALRVSFDAVLRMRALARHLLAGRHFNRSLGQLRRWNRIEHLLDLPLHGGSGAPHA